MTRGNAGPGHGHGRAHGPGLGPREEGSEQQEHQLPRITGLETEYLRAVTAAEAQWVRSVTDDLRAGRLTWSAEALTALADALERGS